MNHVWGPSTRDALGVLRRDPDPTHCPWASLEPMPGCLTVLSSVLTRMCPTKLCLGEDVPG